MKLVLNRRDLEAHAFQRGDEALIVLDRDWGAVHRRPQQARRILMHPLMLESDLREAGVAFEPRDPGLVVPLRKPAQAVGVRIDVPLVRRQAADQCPEEHFGPLVVIVDRLLQLLQRGVQVFIRQVGNRQFALRCNSGCEYFSGYHRPFALICGNCDFR